MDDFDELFTMLLGMEFVGLFPDDFQGGAFEEQPILIEGTPSYQIEDHMCFGDSAEE